MRLRPYIEDKDYEELSSWFTDGRIHAMWCANHIPFPVAKEDFRRMLAEMTEQYGDAAFVATGDDGSLIGFFCYALDLATNEGMYKFVMTNPALRGRGYGREMLTLANKYAFEITGAASVRLIVFNVNAPARRCYEAVGFRERSIRKAALNYEGEDWDKIEMAMGK